METTQEVTVYLGKDIMMPELRSKKSRKVIRSPEFNISGSANLFFVCRAATIGQIAPLILDHKVHLRGLLLLQDVEQPFVGPLLDKAKLRSLRNVLVHGQEGLLERVMRILNAWESRAASKLIADAAVAAEQLLVRACDFKFYAVPFNSLKALSKIEPGNRARFKIASDGSYLHWPDHDIHLDLETFRYAIDPEWRAKKERARLLHNQRFGTAVAELRVESGLRQSDFEGVSEREIRRIEKGETLPHSSTLEILAKAHEMTLANYLAEIASKS